VDLDFELLNRSICSVFAGSSQWDALLRRIKLWLSFSVRYCLLHDFCGWFVWVDVVVWSSWRIWCCGLRKWSLGFAVTLFSRVVTIYISTEFWGVLCDSNMIHEFWIVDYVWTWNMSVRLSILLSSYTFYMIFGCLLLPSIIRSFDSCLCIHQ